MKKWISLIIGTCLATYVHAQLVPGGVAQLQRIKENELKRDTSNNVLVGKWQEYSRQLKDKRRIQDVTFNDTLQLKFDVDSTVEIRTSTALFYTANYFFENGIFRLGNRFGFDFFEIGKQEMHLGEANRIHHFKKVSDFYSAPIEYTKPGVEIGGPISIDYNFLVGKWSTYKKEDKNYNGKHFYLRDLIITEGDKNGFYLAEVNFNSASTVKTEKGTLLLRNEQLEIQLENELQIFNIIKAQENEMILQDGERYYFMKNFSR